MDLQAQGDERQAGRYTFIDLDQCRSEKAHRLIAYWNALRGPRPMPGRREIDPTEIWPLLKNVFLTEWHPSPERLFYRIAGTELVAALGAEVGGKWLTDIYADPVAVARTLDLYRAVVDRGKPVLGRTDGTRLRHGTDTYEWVICPLSDNSRDVTHFIGLEDYIAARPYLGRSG